MVVRIAQDQLQTPAIARRAVLARRQVSSYAQPAAMRKFPNAFSGQQDLQFGQLHLPASQPQHRLAQQQPYGMPAAHSGRRPPAQEALHAHEAALRTQRAGCLGKLNSEVIDERSQQQHCQQRGRPKPPPQQPGASQPTRAQQVRQIHAHAAGGAIPK